MANTLQRHIDSIQDKTTQDDINASFMSVDYFIDEYQPKVTEQDFESFSYYGFLEKGMSFYVDGEGIPSENTSVFGQVSSYIIKIGELRPDRIVYIDTELPAVYFIHHIYRIVR